ncbi:MAG: DUF2029 domain-containing protein [Candidatus Dadabacteria bacterium]|nr:MAG: DUF2029 domain-containing protein [Candidatus Dadabacteria bacterium]
MSLPSLRPILSSRFFSCAAVILFLAVSAGAVQHIFQIAAIDGSLEDSWILGDFRAHGYYAALALREGINPYDAPTFLRRYPVGGVPFGPYSPLQPLFFMPFTLLSVRHADFLYIAITCMLPLLLSWLAIRLANIRPTVTGVFLLGAFLTASRPGYWGLVNGQFGMLETVFTYLVLLGCRTGKLSLSVCGVFLTLMKPSFGGPLLVLLAARREFRTLWWVAGVAAPILVFPVAMWIFSHGLGTTAGLAVRLASNWMALLGNPHIIPERADILSLIIRLAGRPVPGLVQLAATAALLLAGSAMARWHALQTDRRLHAMGDAISCVTILACIYHGTYDAVLLALPLVLLLARGQWPAERVGRWPRWVLATAVLILFANYTPNHMTDWFGQAPNSPLYKLAAMLNGLVMTVVFVTCGIATLSAACRRQASP